MIPLTAEQIAEYQNYWMAGALFETVNAMRASLTKDRESAVIARREANHAYDMTRRLYRERIKLYAPEAPNP